MFSDFLFLKVETKYEEKNRFRSGKISLFSHKKYITNETFQKYYENFKSMKYNKLVLTFQSVIFYANFFYWFIDYNCMSLHTIILMSSRFNQILTSHTHFYGFKELFLLDNDFLFAHSLSKKTYSDVEEGLPNWSRKV